MPCLITWRRSWRCLTQGAPRLCLAVLFFLASSVAVLLIHLPAAGDDGVAENWSFDEIVWLVFVASIFWFGAELRRLTGRHHELGERLSKLEGIVNTMARGKPK